MSNASDFIIENSVLKKYVGPGGAAEVPEGITAIDMAAFSYCRNVTDKNFNRYMCSFKPVI